MSVRTVCVGVAYAESAASCLRCKEKICSAVVPGSSLGGLRPEVPSNALALRPRPPGRGCGTGRVLPLSVTVSPLLNIDALALNIFQRASCSLLLFPTHSGWYRSFYLGDAGVEEYPGWAGAVPGLCWTQGVCNLPSSSPRAWEEGIALLFCKWSDSGSGGSGLLKSEKY